MKKKPQKPAAGNDDHCGTNQDSKTTGGTLASASSAGVGRNSRHPQSMGARTAHPSGRHLGISPGEAHGPDPGGGILAETFEGEIIPFTAAGVYVNATAMCGAFGKKPIDFLRLESAKAFQEALAQDLGTDAGELVFTQRGGDQSKVRNPHFAPESNRENLTLPAGTWLHPDLALECARWLSPRFAIWTNRVIRRILAGDPMPAAPALALEPLESVIIARYRGAAVLIESGGRGYVNHAAVSNLELKLWKRANKWRDKASTRDLIAALSRETGIPEADLLEVRKDTALRGLWLHPVLALDAARLISADFSFWLEKVIRRVATGGAAPALEGGRQG